MKLKFLYLLVFAAGSAAISCAFESGAYIPEYRLTFLPGAESRLGRPALNPDPHSWSGRLTEDYSPGELPENILESSWSLRLGRTYSAYYLHIPLDDRFSSEVSPDFRHIEYLKSIIRTNGTDINLSLIGNTAEYNQVSSSGKAMDDFTQRIDLLCRTYRLDGIDIDWEFPAVPRDSEQESLVKLISRLREKLPESVRISVAVSRWRLPDERLFDIADRVHLMAYDGFGKHSTYESAVADAETILTRFNLPPSELVLGLPFYGRVYLPEAEEYWTGTKNYREIVDDYAPGPDMDETDGYYFNGPRTIRLKAEWALGRELGGVFVWEPFYDTAGASSLSAVLRDVIENSQLSGVRDIVQ